MGQPAPLHRGVHAIRGVVRRRPGVRAEVQAADPGSKAPPPGFHQILIVKKGVNSAFNFETLVFSELLAPLHPGPIPPCGWRDEPRVRSHGRGTGGVLCSLAHVIR